MAAPIASFVCGILAVLTGAVGVGIIFGLLAIGLGNRDGADDGLSKAGRTMGLLSLALGALAIAAYIYFTSQVQI